MGLFEGIRKRRAKTKAEIKAAKAQARAEVKESAKLDLRRAKLLAQQERELLKVEKKGLKAKRKHEKKMADKTLAQLKEGTFNKKTVSRYAGALRMIIPLALPLAYRAMTWLRETLLNQKAARYGLSAHELARFSGHGAQLKARIEKIRESTQTSHLAHGLSVDMRDRLDKLDTAVDNAEYLSPQQRRRAHRSINDDLDLIAGEIQTKLTGLK